MKKINGFAKKLVNRLKREGFTVQYYHARSTNSVYLKLDYGMSHSVRISDHKGKKHLKYRYNFAFTANSLRKVKTKKGELQYFSPFSKMNEMVNIMKGEKERLIKHIGEEKYQEGMLLQYVINEGKPGFWSNYKIL